MDFPTTGEVLISGKPTAKLTDGELTALRRQEIGFVFQFFQLLPSLTALENVELPLLLSGAKNTAATARERLRWVELEGKTASLPFQLSGGQMQRLSIARALVRKPEIYVFDDTFSALDFKTDAKLRAALKGETKQATVIIVAQRVSTVIDADQIIVLDNGKIAGTGKHKNLMKTCDVYKTIVSSQLSEAEIAEEGL